MGGPPHQVAQALDREDVGAGKADRHLVPPQRRGVLPSEADPVTAAADRQLLLGLPVPVRLHPGDQDDEQEPGHPQVTVPKIIVILSLEPVNDVAAKRDALSRASVSLLLALCPSSVEPTDYEPGDAPGTPPGRARDAGGTT